MRFQPSSYIVNEGDTALVCVEVIGASDIEVVITANTAPVDAEGRRCLDIL